MARTLIGLSAEKECFDCKGFGLREVIAEGIIDGGSFGRDSRGKVLCHCVRSENDI